jgi:uncharacterized membrane protein YfcA
MLRELAILVLVFVGFASAVAAYLAAFHGEVTIKEVVSTAFAATLGMYVGRYIERGLARG